MDIVHLTIDFVKDTLKNEEAGHNWWHIQRVWQNSRKLASTYNVNKLLLDLGALLHDISDAKFNGGDEKKGPETAGKFLSTLEVDEAIIQHVLLIIKYISFKNKDLKAPEFIEFKIIQDADRLDAIGAIGISRAFHYGGYKNRELFNPEIYPVLNMNDNAYKKNEGHTINHFYEKLLKIKDMLNTPEAKEIAEQRNRFMLNFLDQFYIEWGLEKPWI